MKVECNVELTVKDKTYSLRGYKVLIVAFLLGMFFVAITCSVSDMNPPREGITLEEMSE